MKAAITKLQGIIPVLLRARAGEYYHRNNEPFDFVYFDKDGTIQAGEYTNSDNVKRVVGLYKQDCEDKYKCYDLKDPGLLRHDEFEWMIGYLAEVDTYRQVIINATKHSDLPALVIANHICALADRGHGISEEEVFGKLKEVSLTYDLDDLMTIPWRQA